MKPKVNYTTALPLPELGHILKANTTFNCYPLLYSLSTLRGAAALVKTYETELTMKKWSTVDKSLPSAIGIVWETLCLSSFKPMETVQV